MRLSRWRVRVLMALAAVASCVLVADEVFAFGVKLDQNRGGRDLHLPLLARLRSQIRTRADLRASLERLVRVAAEICWQLDECWLDSGTLLVAERDGRVIPHDNDGDVGITPTALQRIDAEIDRGTDSAFAPLLQGSGLQAGAGGFRLVKVVQPVFTQAGDRCDVVARLVCEKTGHFVDFFIYFEARDGSTELLNGRRAAGEQTAAALRPILDLRGWCQENGIGGTPRDDSRCASGVDAPPFEYALAHAPPKPLAVQGSPIGAGAGSDGEEALVPPGLLHGVWGLSWSECVHCARGWLEPRRLPALPTNWVFPLRECRVEGVRARCPRETAKVLEYMYGGDWREPPLMQRASTRVLLRGGALAVTAATIGLWRRER